MPEPSPLAAIPESRDERWDMLSGLILDWYPDSISDGGVPESAIATAVTRLGVSIPNALREWYARFGLRSDVWSQQDDLLTLNRMRISSGHLTFVVENQAVVQWGISTNDLSLDDPPVYVTSVDDQNQWLLDSATTSMFAIQRFVYCLKFSRSLRWFANGYFPPAVASTVANGYPQFLTTSSAWPGPLRFYGDRDTMIEIEDRRGGGWLYAVTRTATAATRFRHLLRDFTIEWNATSNEWPDGWVNLSHDMP